MSKTTNLFGEEMAAPVGRKALSRKTAFEDYEGFVEKFKPKKTTDDCYTPEPVYEAIKGWVSANLMPLDGVEVVLLPGGSLRESPVTSRFVRDVTDGLLRAADRARRLGRENGIVTIAVEVSEDFAARHLGGGRHED